MSITLYDATVRANIQVLEGLSGVLAKGLAHAQASGLELDDLVEVRLAPDMLPLRYQVQSCHSHSKGAIEGIRAGVFTPPMPAPYAYPELQALVADTIQALKALDPEEVNSLAGRDVVFRLGERELPFEAADFLLTFSLPNFYFHATTAYDILRSQGVPLAKRDFLGRPRIKTA